MFDLLLAAATVAVILGVPIAWSEWRKSRGKGRGIEGSDHLGPGGWGSL